MQTGPAAAKVSAHGGQYAAEAVVIRAFVDKRRIRSAMSSGVAAAVFDMGWSLEMEKKDGELEGAIFAGAGSYQFRAVAMAGSRRNSPLQ
jgi:hypothetical protein